jgi:hypothetical protein
MPCKMKFTDELDEETEWTRKLYIRHNRPDNYVDKTFLKFKKTNGLNQ